MQETENNAQENSNKSSFSNDVKYSIAGKNVIENIQDRKLYTEAKNVYDKAKKMANEGKSNKEIFETTDGLKETMEN